MDINETINKVNRLIQDLDDAIAPLAARRKKLIDERTELYKKKQEMDLENLSLEQQLEYFIKNDPHNYDIRNKVFEEFGVDAFGRYAETKQPCFSVLSFGRKTTDFAVRAAKIQTVLSKITPLGGHPGPIIRVFLDGLDDASILQDGSKYHLIVDTMYGTKPFHIERSYDSLQGALQDIAKRYGY